jgi:Putative MetA-pathway of phenol degradation
MFLSGSGVGSHLGVVTKRFIVSSLGGLLVAGLALGQSAASDASASPIVTDRPAVTDSSIVIPLGSLQFENGIADTVAHGEQTIDGSESLVRFGIASKTELRLTAPDYFSQAGATSGFGDLLVGVKRQIAPAGGFDVSLVVSLSLPSGANAI